MNLEGDGVIYDQQNKYVSVAKSKIYKKYLQNKTAL